MDTRLYFLIQPVCLLCSSQKSDDVLSENIALLFRGELVRTVTRKGLEGELRIISVTCDEIITHSQQVYFSEFD
jgi:predicted transcriptional regulator